MKLFYVLLATLLFTACQQDNGEVKAVSTVNDTVVTTDGVTMQKDTLYTMNSGDTIMKLEEDTIIKISKTTQVQETTAELLEGSAKIILANDD